MRALLLGVSVVSFAILGGCLSSIGQEDSSTPDTATTPPATTVDTTDSGIGSPDTLALRNDTVLVNHTVEAPMTKPFEEWAQLNCPHIDADGVMLVLDQRLSGDLQGLSVGVQTNETGATIHVYHTVTLDRDGNVESEPTVSFERVQTTTPSAVAVTLTHENQSYTCHAPVQPVNRTIHEN